MKKVLGGDAGCSNAEPKILAPPKTPFPGVRDSQNLISWRWSLPLPTNIGVGAGEAPDFFV